MQQSQLEIARRVGTTLQAYFDRIVMEPVPERWVDLIRRLNEEERRQQCSKPTIRRTPPP